jgi:PiT family inorganic phosphate transporter
MHGMTISLRFMVAFALSMGVLLGGRRILKKLGMKFYRIRDAQGLSAELTSAGTVLACSMTGFPASTTQVIAGSIIGAGVAKNPRMVRWPVVREIMTSWLITFPSVSVLSFLLGESLKWGWQFGL